ASLHVGPLYLAISESRRIHCGLHPTSLWRSAPVVRDGRHVLDLRDPETHRVERAHGRFAAGPGSLDADLDVLDAVVLRGRACALRRHLSGERRALARALEPATACRRPGQRVALPVRDRDDRVVEGGVDMRHGVQNLTLDLLLDPSRWLL